jgi:hypothetical protein
VLVFPDVRAALDWLTEVFDFTERLRIGEARRSQLQADADGAVIVADVWDDQVAPDPGVVTHLIKVRAEEVDAQVERAPCAWRASSRTRRSSSTARKKSPSSTPPVTGASSPRVCATAPQEWGGFSV